MSGVPLAEVVAYADEFLRVREVADERNAVNGLQVENRGTVSGIVAAVGALLIGRRGRRGSSVGRIGK